MACVQMKRGGWIISALDSAIDLTELRGFASVFDLGSWVSCWSEPRYFTIVENRRVSGGQVLQRHALYLPSRKGTRWDQVLFVLRRKCGDDCLVSQMRLRFDSLETHERLP